MFVDSYGNEFKTEKEVEEFARKKLYEDEEDFVNYIECEFSATKLINWILINDYKDNFATIEKLYAEDYFFNYDVEEIEED